MLLYYRAGQTVYKVRLNWDASFLLLEGRNTALRRKTGSDFSAGSNREQAADFTYWERRYGRELSEVEKLEIKHNLLGLLSLIGQVYDSKPDYFDGLLDGIRQERAESMKRLLTQRKIR
jgi:elongation factor P hydroxylase